MLSTSQMKVTKIVQDAGGEIVGRTRLQKIAYLLIAGGFEDGIEFSYKHYGPFSEDLSNSAREAHLLGYLEEEQRPAQWGGTYSIYKAPGADDVSSNPERKQLAQKARSADSIELELAATALFLHYEGCIHPWVETQKRKPEKAKAGRLERAKQLYKELSKISAPRPFPEIV